MRLFFACSHSAIYYKLLQQCDAENILISYAFAQDADKLNDFLKSKYPKNLIIDSGAFSVWSKGDRIDIDRYIRFCKKFQTLLPSEVNLYIVNLDVLPGKFGRRPTEQQRIESAEKGWQNMLRIEEEGLKVIHVFHQHEPFEWLDKLRQHSDYIGISPANDVSMKEKLNWLNQVFGIIKDTVKTHGFAVTSHEQLYRYPFFSVDSSSWLSPSRYGRIPIFLDNLTMKSIEYKKKDDVLKYWSYLKDVGIEKLGSDEYQNRVIIAIKSFQKLQEIATKLWQKRGIIWKDVDKLG